MTLSGVRVWVTTYAVPLLLALAVVIVLVLVGIGWWNSLNKQRTAATVQKNTATVAEGQRSLDTEVQTKEVETVRHESTITIRSEPAAARVEAVPVGRQLSPLLDELCGMRSYERSAECTSRVQYPGDSSTGVRGSPASEE